MDSWRLLLEIVLLLGACVTFGAICSWLKQSPLVGYLAAGMLLGGPGSLGLIRAEHEIESVAELGVALFLFSLGLEFSWKRLMGLGGKILASGAIQVALTLIAAAAVSMLFGIGAKEAVVIGAMLSLSSTAAVLRVFMERGDIDSLYARNSVAILLIQDMAVVPLAVLMTLVSEGGTPVEIATSLVKITGMALGLVAVLHVLLNKIAVRVLNALTAEQNRELTVVLAIVAGLGAAWAAHAVNLSPALGAFIAGMFLGSSPFAVQLRSDIASLRTILLTLFFGTVGMVANPIWIAEHLPFVLGVASLIIVLKAAITCGILRAFGQLPSVAVATGLCISQVGEFAFVLGSTGREKGVVSEQIYMVIVSSTIATLFLTPYLVRVAPLMANWLERRRSLATGPVEHAESDEPHPEVILVGFGPAGQAVGRALADKGRNVLVIDVNPQAKLLAESLGLHGQIGDGTQIDVLEHAHIHTAKMIVVTLPAREPAMMVLHHVKRLAPTAHVVVRSRYQLHLSDFEQAGADAVIGDEEQVGYRLSAYVGVQLTMLDEAGPHRDAAAS